MCGIIKTENFPRLSQIRSLKNIGETINYDLLFMPLQFTIKVLVIKHGLGFNAILICIHNIIESIQLSISLIFRQATL